MPLSYIASASSKPGIILVGEDVMNCRGNIIDTVPDVKSGPRHVGVGSLCEPLEIMQGCDRVAAFPKRINSPCGEDIVDLLWRTLVMNAGFKEYPSPRYWCIRFIFFSSPFPDPSMICRLLSDGVLALLRRNGRVASRSQTSGLPWKGGGGRCYESCAPASQVSMWSLTLTSRGGERLVVSRHLSNLVRV